jgi:predicted acetyltransferase
MTTAGLIVLDERHGDALERFLKEFDERLEERNGYFCQRAMSIGRVVSTLNAQSRGEGMQPGWVPCSTLFWYEDDVIMGVINIRHRLTPALERMGGHIGYSVAPTYRRRGVARRMLRGALMHCEALGISSVLLTCDASNQGSIRTIESNGGRLDREAYCESLDRLERWYWIHL